MKKSFVPISKQSKKAQKDIPFLTAFHLGHPEPGNADHAKRRGIQPEKAGSKRQKRQGILLRLPAAFFLSVPAYQSHRFRKYFVISSMPCFRHRSRYSRNSFSAASHFSEISAYSGTSLIIYRRCVCSRFSLAISSSVFSFSPNMPYFVVNSSCAKSCSSSYRFFFLHVSSFASRNKKFHSSQDTVPFPDIFFLRSLKGTWVTMVVDTKVMNHVRNNRKEPLVNRPGVTVTVSIPQSLINADDILFPYGNPFP